MTQPDEITRTRLRRVHRRLLDPAVRGATALVTISAHHVRGEPISFADAMARPYEAFAVGDAWGSMWDTTWFRISGEVPAEWAGDEVVLVVHLGYGGGTGFGAEGLVWRHGEPLQGISPNHDEVIVAAPARGGEDFEVWIEAAANPVVDARLLDPQPHYLAEPDGPQMLRLQKCHLAVANREVKALRDDWAILSELYDSLDPITPRAAQLLRTLDRAANVLDPNDIVGSAPAVRAALKPALDRPAAASAHRFAAVGNAHIDTAWLWPLRETQRKCARTFSTAVTLMDRYPDYRFAASQALQFSWIKDQYPALFERIRKKVADGAFEPVGSMWVEADCNVPSGESLVRQIVHGKRFFASEFGVDTKELWLPDVFGYSAALPQILRLAGISRFLTQKLSWNQVNKMPHHTFWWEGIDGSRVFTHFPPADTYNGDMSVRELQHGERNFREKAITDRSMYLYGFGDGGGGPTAEHIERARRTADLEGAPRVELVSVTDAWDALESSVDHDELPVWVGELYFEMHRGTYTTHGDVKRANRKLELALRDAELWSVAAGVQYPAEELDAAWKRLLVHQFHDIIPGTSIHWAYRDAERDHAALYETTGAIIDHALGAIAGSVATDGQARPVLVANPLAFARRELVEVDGRLAVVDAPACGWAVCDLDAPSDDLPPVEVGDGWMANGALRVEWDNDGLLTSVRHLASGRDALVAGQRGNLLQTHDDRPNHFDAWDIDAVAYDTVVDHTDAESVEVITASSERGALRVVRRIGDSTVEQEIRLDRGARRVEIHSVVDWHETHTLLKAAFPLDVRSANASFEIQHGHVERPTHRNTSWDEARYEVCAQTWADLSESGFGVGLLNDCKYGHDVLGNVLRLTLLRSPTWPDPVADQGRHVFSYALLPHEGDLVQGAVVREAHAFNSPLRVVPIGGGADGSRGVRASVIEVDDAAVVVTAVKQADDGDGVIVRLYESAGGRHEVRVRCGGRTTAARVDLLERPLDPPIDVVDGAAVVPLRPFELATLRFQ
jgi:alpha-mannosidase